MEQEEALSTLLDGIKFSPDLAAYLNAESNKAKVITGIVENYSKAEFIGLGLSEGTYYELRTTLNRCQLTTGDMIVAKQGQLGGLKLYKPEIPSIPKSPTEVLESIKETNAKELLVEKDYYPIVKNWAQEQGMDCAILGGKLPGYKWENPDLVVIDYLVDQFACAVSYDVTSIEVKLGVEPSGVWQAAHYRLFSHRVYIAFAQSERDVRNKDDGRVFELAVTHGLGVLCFENNNFKEIQSPTYGAAPAGRTIEFISRLDKYEGTTVVINRIRGDHSNAIKRIFMEALA